LRTKTLILIAAIVSLLGSSAYGIDGKPFTGSEKVFHYSATSFGIPILKASIRIESGTSEQGRPIYQIRASIYSLDYLKFLFRINNRFLSTVEAETLAPLQYVKEIHQEGLLTKKKNYLQTLTFDHSNKKLVVENRKGGERKDIPLSAHTRDSLSIDHSNTKLIEENRKDGERKEIPLSTETYDPLSIFAKYYLKDELHLGQDIQMSIFDGMKLRRMVFVSRREKVTSKLYGEVEAVCLESSTAFSSFDDKEGKIRIWYADRGEKIPILIELELPVGNIKFELESVE